jgi:hypothetical protein
MSGKARKASPSFSFRSAFVVFPALPGNSAESLARKLNVIGTRFSVKKLKAVGEKKSGPILKDRPGDRARYSAQEIDLQSSRAAKTVPATDNPPDHASLVLRRL